MSEQPAREKTAEKGQAAPARKAPSSEKPQRPRRSPSSDAAVKRPAAASADAKPKRPTSTRRETPPEDSAQSERSGSSEQGSGTKLNARKAAATAVEQLGELTTRTPESVVGVERLEEGWRVTVEVVESARIPDSTDIMAEYEIMLDSDGDMTSYTRTARYSRGRTGE